MRQYRTSLQKRRRRVERFKERYWTDPQYRLDRINADRIRRGRPVLGSLDEIKRRTREAGMRA